jgi:starch synthase (maltosyl-transferring)
MTAPDRPRPIPMPIDNVNISALRPELDGGRYPVKRVTGDLFEVEADIFTHGHDVVRAVLQHRLRGAREWLESEMVPLENDRWRGSWRLEQIGFHEYTIFAWRDPFLSWAQELRKKHDAGQDLTSELLEGKALVERAIAAASETDARRLGELLLAFDRELGPVVSAERALELLAEVERGDRREQAIAELRRVIERGFPSGSGASVATGDPIRDVILGDELRLLMAITPDRRDGGRYRKVLEVFVDRPEAAYGAWYEMWPRSQGSVPSRSATFAEMEHRLEEIRWMGFNVVYLTPIHPIGRSHRKGPNNSLVCPPGSPGCPYAIGNELGGHTAIEPELGTIEDFRRFERTCRSMGLEIALDVALQTSPDHPWVKAHPEWFRKRPDGTIKFAENPPKKYEDIYPLDFSTEDKEGLWNEVLSVFRFWMDEGVRIFRVDNPHTKPVQFWEWLVAEIHATDPDVLLLSEAFTRPKMMKALAKAGFTQSYTYFTWRNFKRELTDYFRELCQTEVADYLRGNLFTNTPDILPYFLQNAPRSAFKIRATLAATLSSLWGIYNGFELCEGTPIPGKEEYLDSEKYDFKVWDWNRPGNIKEYISRLNRIRAEQPALQGYRNLRFYEADNESILFYGKASPDGRGPILVLVNLDPFRAQESSVMVPISELGLRPDETYQLHDLISDRRYFWRGERNYVRLDPENEVAHVFRLLRYSHREQDFDYFL